MARLIRHAPAVSATVRKTLSRIFMRRENAWEKASLL
jgi:hypothetical protein